ncbi:MAG: MFS transporter, partial [Candidatus Omnitrophica bacterium]|nr:MFS transporter [Candidatus Omnitrophota bacterium]
RGSLVLMIPMIFMAWKSMVPIYIIVFLVFCCSRFYVPAKMSIIPDLVTKENLLMANSLMTTTGMIAFVLGCALGGFWVDKWGAWGGFMGDAATFFISALLIVSIGRDFRMVLNHRRILAGGKEFLKIETSLLKEIREGLRYLVDRREIRFVVAMLFILLSAAGAVYVVIIIFIQNAFQSVTRDLGILAVALGLGLFVGAIVYGKWGKKISCDKTIFICLIAGGIMMTAFTLGVSQRPHIGAAIFLAGMMGLVIGPIFIAANTIAQVVSEEHMRGKVFSALEIVIHFAFLISMLASSLMSKYIDEKWILITVAGIFTIVGVVGFLWSLRRGPLVTLK